MGRLSSDFPNAQAVDVALKRANKAEVDVANLTTAMGGKVDNSAFQTETQNLQGQINQIVISASAESVVAPEVAAARVDLDGTEYETLKTHLDADKVFSRKNRETLSESLNPLRTSDTFTRVFTTEDNRLETSYTFYSYRGYGYYCHIPELLCGVYLNLKISGSGTNVSVPIRVAVLDKDTYAVLWSQSINLQLTFTDGFGYIRHQKVSLDAPRFGLPDTAYVMLSVEEPYTLATLINPVQTLINDALFISDETYKTIYIDANNEIRKVASHHYLCDFGLYSAKITDKNLDKVSDEFIAVKESLVEKDELLRGFNTNFNLTNVTYSFDDYRGYGYLINVPKVFSGVWLNIIITPETEFAVDYSADVPIIISLRDKDTKKVLYEYTSTVNADFIAADGFAKLRDTSLMTNEPVVGLPDQCYLCIILPIGYKLNVTTDNRSTKFASLLALDTDYPNIYIQNSSQKFSQSDGLYKYTCDIGIYSKKFALRDSSSGRIYTLHDAFMAWSAGEKFPIAFAGDSTTDGYRTTNYVANVLGTDHTTGYLYTDVLQSLLRAETENNQLRIYNAGFSGKTVLWMLSNFDAEFGSESAYADVKMIGISFGINDKPNTPELYKAFKSDLITLCRKCLANGIQPFLLTSQVGAENSDTLGRYETKIVSYANKAKHEVAEELGLELIDISTITARLMQYSNHPLNSILYDYCHFADYGHALEGGVLFKTLIPRTITVTGHSRIGFETQGIKSDLQWGDQSLKQVQMLPTVTNGFKTIASVSGRESDDDIIVLDAWVYIDTEPLSLTAYSGEVGTLHMYIDNTEYEIVSTEHEIELLDCGLHHIVVKSGSSASISFYGFKFQ